MITRETAKKIMSLGTHNKLNDLLFKLDHVKTVREQAGLQEKLKEYLGKLFTYREVFEFHNDHIQELAETLAGLYPERDNLEDYTYFILAYLNRKIRKYDENRKRMVQRLSLCERIQQTDPDAYLDQKYLTWTYTEGYYYQQACMYRLLHQTLTELVKYSKKGASSCRKKGVKKMNRSKG